MEMNIDSKCSGCDSFLIDCNDEQFVECLNQYYHVKCFTCKQCGHSASSKESGCVYQSMNMNEQNEEFICQQCLDGMMNKCDKCSQQITHHDDEYLIQSDGNNQNKFHHMNCFQIKCVGCEKQILTQNDTKYWRLDSGFNYHLECLKCHFCQKLIDQTEYKASTESGKFVFCCNECFNSKIKKTMVSTPKNHPRSSSTVNNRQKQSNSCCSLRIMADKTSSSLTPKAMIANRQRQNLQTALQKSNGKILKLKRKIAQK